MFDTQRIQIDFGDPASGQNTPPDAEFVLAPPKLWTTIKVMLAPDLWVGESYVAGKWYLIKGHLPDFLCAIQQGAKFSFKAYYEFISTLRGIRYYLRQFILNKYYTRQVRRHYEVDSKIYEMILDEEMLYTCAFFFEEEETLAAAQQNKVIATIERMGLPSGTARVLDIGSGWGGMARAIVRRHEAAEVCGLSISSGQIEWAKQHDAKCLSEQQVDRIEYRLQDYVNHDRCDYYDAISVVGMIEHVGLGGYDEFFEKIHSFLKSAGTAVVHTIVSPLPATPTNGWIDKHVFTGGYTPSMSELIKAAEKCRFRISGVHVYPPMHYRRTIECWLDNFLRNAGAIQKYLKGVDYAEGDIEKFMRTWMFYLSGVRNMFVGNHGRCHQVIQLSIRRL
jgi:cyclopropane-fatty-acyl-phospholipid synthase